MANITGPRMLHFTIELTKAKLMFKYTIASAFVISAVSLSFGSAQAADISEGSRPFGPVPAAELPSYFYVGVSGGLAFQNSVYVEITDFVGAQVKGDVDLEIGYNIRAEIGVNLVENVRIQAGIGHIRHEIDFRLIDDVKIDVDANSTYILGSVFYDLPITGEFNAFVGVGAGIAFNRAEVNMPNNGSGTIGDTDYSDGASLALSASLGASYKIADNVSLTGDYSYLYTDGLEAKRAIKDLKADFDAHTINLGLRFSF